MSSQKSDVTSVVRLAEIKVRGVVQGVGFRPFVYQLATANKLNGWVRNTSGNVEIEVEGDEAAVGRFLKALEADAPPLSHIETIDVAYHPPRGYTHFEIRHSLAQEGKYQLVSPDIATCVECKRELSSPRDRRYRYPFTNCTNCGPRFTIIEDIPYDRPRTTMRSFKMCPRCQAEYDNPLDRRFHAQPNACPVCGPELELRDSKGLLVETQDVIKSACQLLLQGKILALKGLGGFHLACDATNKQAVEALRQRKRRLYKPLAIMVATIDEVKHHCQVSPEEETLLLSPQCPIVLLKWKENSSSVCPEVAPALKYLGVMLPYTPLHHILLSEVDRPLVMTSGNLSEEPIAKDNDEALRRLKDIADYFVLHNRDIYSRYDDSVFLVEKGVPRPARRARGYAPYPIHLPFASRQVLACGAELKNTFCLTKDNYAFIGQHIGDMENLETMEHFETTLKLYRRLFRLNPEVVAYDMHPEYLSTKYAMELQSSSEGKGLEFVPVQHHHAHIASCMAENGGKMPVIGVSLDGVGYGSDGCIWGGEFLIAEWQDFRRWGHLEYVPMPGGSSAILKPYRMAVAFIYTLLGKNATLEGLPILSQIDRGEMELIKRQIDLKLNSPLTSSCGRLFDAVSAIAGIRGTIDYEAQAAVELEMLASEQGNATAGRYPFSLEDKGETHLVRLGELIATVVEDVRKKTPVSVIADRFHNTLSGIIIAVCKEMAKESGIKTVALSGGVFQNRLLFRLVTGDLEREGFQVLTHKLVPCNDGGISLGQAAIAHFVTSMKGEYNVLSHTYAD